VVDGDNYKTTNTKKIAQSKYKFSLRISLGKLMRQAQDVDTGILVEVAVNAYRLRPALLAILLLVLLLPRPATAESPSTFEKRCEQEMHPSIVVTAQPQGYVVHNSVSSRVLSTRGAYTRPGQSMMGMTASSTRAIIDIDAPGLSDAASGRECIAPRISVELSYQPLDVYVARELHPASCSYREIYAHELQHVKIYADNLPRIESAIRSELMRRYGGRPLYAPRHEGVTILHDQIDSWLRPLIKAELAKVEEEQVKLDSRDEVERLSHLCQGEIASLMGSSF
jgi:hypothetical protein